MHSLPVFLKLNDRPVIVIGKGEAAESKRRLLERAGARVVGEDDASQLAIVAIEEAEEAGRAVARLKARGILVNATDRPSLCDFTLPAIVDREPVLVAIGTGGASAGLAKALRIAIEAMLPATLGGLAKALFDMRGKIRARWPGAGDRRHALDVALAQGGPLDPLSGADGDAVARWIVQAGNAPPRAFETITLSSADPDDLTLREARWLGRADRIFHQPDIPATILQRARADAARHASATPPETDEPGLTLWLRWSA